MKLLKGIAIAVAAAVGCIGFASEAQAQFGYGGFRVGGPIVVGRPIIPTYRPIVTAPIVRTPVVTPTVRVPVVAPTYVTPLPTYRSLSPVYPVAPVISTPAVIRPGIGGLPNVYIPRQPVRNALRFAIP